MASAGRPSKLTTDTIKTLTDAIGLGASYVDACIMAGISYETFMKWKQRGEKENKGEYVQFIQAVEKAKTAGKMRHLAVLNNAAAKGDWKASLEWLRRMYRTEWGDSSRVEQSNYELNAQTPVPILRRVAAGMDVSLAFAEYASGVNADKWGKE